MLLIEEFIEQSNKATSVEELFEHYRRAMHELGFDQIIFSLMTDHKHIERPSGHGIMLNYSESWMKYYQEKDYESFDPVRRHMYAAPTLFVWDELLAQTVATRTQKLLMHEGHDAGLKDGIGIPLHGPHGALAGVGAASSAGGVELDDKNLLSRAHLLAQQFYAAYLHLEVGRLESVEPQLVRLTDREQEVLKWCARGKSKPEIAEILKLSENTVHSYVKESLRKLEAKNVTLGVLRALQMGLIQI